jgi:hypothetical protein
MSARLTSATLTFKRAWRKLLSLKLHLLACTELWTFAKHVAVASFL